MNNLKELISAINYAGHMEAIHNARSQRLVKESAEEVTNACEANKYAQILTEELHTQLFNIMLGLSPRKFLKLLGKLNLCHSSASVTSKTL